MDKAYTAIGLMSGTSLDGIDASIIRSDGEKFIDIKKNLYLPYDEKFKKKLANFIESNESAESISKKHVEYKDLEKELTKKHVDIINKINEKKYKVDLIGFHGQTITHRPELKYSIQMGDANLLSKLSGKKVIFNFRKKDIENGGDGAPLSPIYHYNLSNIINLSDSYIVLNIGGVSNVSFINKDVLKARDVGPGNVLMDEFLKKTKNLNYDKDGILAEKGFVDHDIVKKFLQEKQNAFKNKHSMNRADFDFSFVRGLKFENALATLTYFTAKVISSNIKLNFSNNSQIILCGGGRKNKTLIKFLKELINTELHPIDKYGIDGDFIESQCFGYLAIRSYLKKKISFPSTTNVKFPCYGGELVININNQ